MSKNTPRDTYQIRKPLFPQLETETNLGKDFFIFLETSHSTEKGSARKPTLSQAEISYENQVVPFDQMKVSEDSIFQNH